MPDQYTYWREELKNPGCNERDTDRQDIAGFWRLRGAVTKADYPLAIWPSKADPTKLIARVGNVQHTFAYDSTEFFELLTGAWLNSKAVPKDEYDYAMANDKWPDGKISRIIEKEEEPQKEPEPAPDPQPVMNAPKPEPKDEPPGIGHNNPPEQMGLEYAEQIKAEAALLKELAVKDIDDEVAEQIGELKNRVTGIKKDATAEHKKQKEPWLEGGRKVDAAFKPTITACEDIARQAGKALTGYLEEKQREQERKAEEERKARQAEEDRRAREKAELAGEDPEKAEAKEVKAKVENASVGAAAGRKVTTTTVKTGEITDADKFIEQVKDRDDFKEFLQSLANRAARAGKELPGMKIVEKKEVR